LLLPGADDEAVVPGVDDVVAAVAVGFVAVKKSSGKHQRLLSEVTPLPPAEPAAESVVSLLTTGVARFCSCSPSCFNKSFLFDASAKSGWATKHLTLQ
jgi:hypothetical protein